MKILTLILAICLASCAVHDPIQMTVMPVKLTRIYKPNYAWATQLTLNWQSLDGKIFLQTQVPIEDSNVYRIGMIYQRCFLPK